jgi:hypothetical protein
MRKIVALLGCFIAFEVTYSHQRSFAQSHRDKAVINNFIARQERKERADEYEEGRSIVRGDLNGEGDEDAVVLYTLEGHRGTNQYVQYLAVFVNRRGRLMYTTHDVVGGKNRRAIESVLIKDGKINLQTEEYLPTDPSCCPSKKGQMSFILSRGRLKGF